MFWKNLPKTRFPSQMPMFFFLGKLSVYIPKERITKNLGKLFGKNYKELGKAIWKEVQKTWESYKTFTQLQTG